MDIQALLEFQATSFIAMALGFFMRKLGLLHEKTSEVLGDLILNLALPCSIVLSFLVDFDPSVVSEFLLGFLVTSLTMVLAAVVNHFAYKKSSTEEQKVLKYSTYVSNSGFLGLVIASGMYPQGGMLHASITSIPLRIVMWSIALFYFTPSKSAKDSLLRLATNPCLVAVYLGLAILLTGYKLPNVLEASLRSIGQTATPLSMVLVGALLAAVTDARTFFDLKVLLFSLFRLVLFPLVVYLGCLLFGVTGITRGVAVMFSAMPAAVTTAVIAAKYKGDTTFATKVVVTSTLLSVATIPIWQIILLS